MPIDNLSTFVHFRGPLLPFDTLLLPVSAQEKLKIVSFYSSDMYDGHKLRKYVDHQRKNVETLRIGFISFDFNDHPTAHLVEGIFHTVQQLREKGARRGLSWPHKTELIVYSYGKDDGSSYRNRLSTVSKIVCAND